MDISLFNILQYGSYNSKPDGEQITWSQDPMTATLWTTDEKILLAKFNIVGIDLKSMLQKYFNVSIISKAAQSTRNGVIPAKDYFTIDIGSYFATLNNVKQYLFPSLNTNVTDALNKILIGEGVIKTQPVVVNNPTIQQVVSTTPITTQSQPVVNNPINTSTGNTATSNPTPASSTSSNPFGSFTFTPPTQSATTPNVPTTSTTKDYTMYYIGGGVLVLIVIGTLFLTHKKN